MGAAAAGEARPIGGFFGANYVLKNPAVNRRAPPLTG
jgi:hypothetical protein